MEAAEGETEEPIGAARRGDGGGTEGQVVRVDSVGRVRRARPGVGEVTGGVQTAIVRRGVASTGIPQRRKRNELVRGVQVQIGRNRCRNVEIFG